jgi:hypothetical protein
MKYSMLFATTIALLISGTANSAWLKTYGTAEDDSTQSFIKLDQGGYVITGQTGNTHWYSGLDQEGNVLWSKSSSNAILAFDETGNVKLFEFRQLGTDIDANYAIINGSGKIDFTTGAITNLVVEKSKKITGNDGNFNINSEDNTIEGSWKTSATNTDTAFAKIDANNNVVWSHLYDKGNNDLGIIYPVKSGYILTHTDFNIDINTHKPIYTTTFTKLNETGGIIAGSSRQITGDFSSFFPRLLNNGSVLLFGSADKNFYLIKLDSNFNFVWGKQYASNNPAERLRQTYAVNEASNGDLEIGSYVQRNESATILEQHPIGIRIDTTTGEILDKKEVKIRQLDSYSFSKADNGKYFLDGLISNTSAGSDAKSTDSDGLFALFNGAWDLEWARAVVGTNYDKISNFLLYQNSYYLTGDTNSWGAGKQDQLFGKLDNTGSIANCSAIQTIDTANVVGAEITAVNLASPVVNVDDPKDNGTFSVTVQETQYAVDVGVTDFPITFFNVCSAPDSTPTGTISLSSATLDFGNVALKQTASLDLTITNTGNGPLKINSLSAATTPFSKLADNCTGTSVLAGGNCKVTYKFSPTAEINSTNAITISYEDPSAGTTTATLKGTGGTSTTPPAVQALTPSDLGVGTVLTINGKGFGSKKNKVLIGKKTATLGQWNDSSIQVKLPAMPAGVYDVKVVPKAKAAIGAGQITLHKPEIASVDKLAGPKKTEVTIAGNYFGTGVKPKVFLISGKKRTAVTVVAKSYSATGVKIKIPKLSKAGDYRIVVNNSAGDSSNAINFTYQK